MGVFGAQALGGRIDDFDLLTANLAILARMWVDAAEADARRRDAEVAFQRGVHDAAGFGDEVCGQRWNHGGERLMNRDERHPQAAADEHHYRLGRLSAIGGEFGKVLCVAGMLEASAVEERLRYGVGDNSGGLAGAHMLDGEADGVDDRGRSGGIGLTARRRAVDR